METANFWHTYSGNYYIFTEIGSYSTFPPFSRYFIQLCKNPLEQRNIKIYLDKI